MINIITPCFNKLDYTKDFLESLYKWTPEDKFRLFMIDDGSTDGTMKYMKGFKKKVSNMDYYSTRYNYGFVKSVNKGISHYLKDLKIDKKEFICLLNNDIVINGKWVDDVYSIFDVENKTVMIGPSGNKELAGRNVKFISNSRSIYRSWVFNKIGYLDENIIHGYYDDVDMTLRVLREGYKIKKFVIPSTHSLGTSFRQIINTSRIREANRLYVIKKHKNWILENL